MNQTEVQIFQTFDDFCYFTGIGIAELAIWALAADTWIIID